MKSLLMIAFVIATSSFVSLPQVWAQNYSFENTLTAPSIFTINNIRLNQECSNKAAIPITMPKGAKGCFFSITVVPKKEQLSPAPQLLSQVKTLSKTVDLDHIVDGILPKITEKVCNIYLITGKENIDLFTACKYLKPAPAFIQSKSRSGYVENKEDGETIYLGFENPYGTGKSIQLKVELVAVL